MKYIVISRQPRDIDRTWRTQIEPTLIKSIADGIQEYANYRNEGYFAPMFPSQIDKLHQINLDNNIVWNPRGFICHGWQDYPDNINIIQKIYLIKQRFDAFEAETFSKLLRF